MKCVHLGGRKPAAAFDVFPEKRKVVQAAVKLRLPQSQRAAQVFQASCSGQAHQANLEHAFQLIPFQINRTMKMTIFQQGAGFFSPPESGMGQLLDF